jgi:hypothetical protein
VALPTAYDVIATYTRRMTGTNTGRERERNGEALPKDVTTSDDDHRHRGDHVRPGGRRRRRSGDDRNDQRVRQQLEWRIEDRRGDRDVREQ